jgi:hypothetical protein
MEITILLGFVVILNSVQKAIVDMMSYMGERIPPYEPDYRETSSLRVSKKQINRKDMRGSTPHNPK